MRARIIILSVYVFCCLSCTKKPLSGQLPVVSTTGSMTFGCILNGSTAYVVTDTLVYNGGGWNINCYTGIKAEFYAGTFNIFTYDCLANTYEFNMVIGGLLSGNGTYLLSSAGKNCLEMHYVDLQGVNYYYQTDSLHTGSVTFIRASGGIYSGTFSGLMVLPGTDKTFTITDGRFDVKTD